MSSVWFHVDLRMDVLEKDLTSCSTYANHSRPDNQHDREGEEGEGGDVYDHLKSTNKNVHFHNEFDMHTSP